jgi:hypothetical protein
MAEDALELIKKQLQNPSIELEDGTNPFEKNEVKVDENKVEEVPKPVNKPNEMKENVLNEQKPQENKQVSKKEEKIVEEKKETKKEAKISTNNKKSNKNKTNNKESKKMSKKKTNKNTNKKKTNKKAARKPRKNKSKQNFKKYIIPVSIFVGLVIVLLILKFAVFNNIEDKTVVAYVNSEPIYLSEINQRYDLYQGAYPKQDLLNQTIAETLLLQEAEESGIKVTEKEFEDLMSELYASTGTTREDLNAELKKVALSYEEYKESSMKNIAIRQLIDIVLVNISVTEQEIKDYYEMVKAEIPENVTYTEVKDLINQSLLVDKRDIAFNEYLSRLENEAEITIFSDLIEEKTEDLDKKEELANCLTSNNIKMYSSTTCSACSTQKNMFGSAVELLDIVECDTEEGQQECQDMAIKATPTWIVNGVKYTGVLSLEGLAELADCEY